MGAVCARRVGARVRGGARAAAALALPRASFSAARCDATCCTRWSTARCAHACPDVLGSLHVATGLAAVERDAALRALTARMSGVRDGGVGDQHVGVDVAERLAASARAKAAASELQASLAPLDGLSNARSTRTALAMLVPSAVCEKINAVRASHDPAFARWAGARQRALSVCGRRRGGRCARGRAPRGGVWPHAAVPRDAQVDARVCQVAHALSRRGDNAQARAGAGLSRRRGSLSAVRQAAHV